MRMSDLSSYVCSADLAISGAMAAVRNNIDLFGAAFTGFVTAIGGGSLRDIFLNLRPVWVDDGNYLLAILAGVLIAVWLRSILGKLARTLSSEEHTSELQSLMRISYAVFCL